MIACQEVNKKKRLANSRLRHDMLIRFPLQYKCVHDLQNTGSGCNGKLIVSDDTHDTWNPSVGTGPMHVTVGRG